MDALKRYIPFTGDTYKTPADRKFFLFNYLMLGTRWAFYLRNFYVYYVTGRAGAKGLLDEEMQAACSYQNMRVAEGCGARIHVNGLDNISKPEGPVILIGNHMSLLETAVMSAFVTPRKPAIFVVKQALFNIPIFGDIMRGMGNIGVDRGNARDDFKKVMSEGEKKLSEGKSIIIYPQSTRAAKFDPSKFNSIGVKLAKKTGASIIPFALKTDFLENGKWVKDLGPVRRKKTVYFEFGEPIVVEGNGKAEHQHIVDFVQENIAKWEED